MSKASEMLKRASRYAVSSRKSRSRAQVSPPAIGETVIIERELYEDALRKAGKRIWSAQKATKKRP
jgi:hypothetical protein